MAGGGSKSLCPTFLVSRFQEYGKGEVVQLANKIERHRSPTPASRKRI
jgi:hypothetical protein